MRFMPCVIFPDYSWNSIVDFMEDFDFMKKEM